MENCPAGCSCNWKKPAHNERLVTFVRLLHHSESYIDQTPGRSGINGLQHALRCAALCDKYGEGREDAFIGLVHDLGRPLNDVHHGEVVAEMVRDRVSYEAYQVLRTHGQYQAAIVHGNGYPHQPWSEWAIKLAQIEVRSFDTDYTGPVYSMDAATRLLEKYLG